MDSGDDTAQAWDETCGGIGFGTDALETRYTDWLYEHVEPLETLVGYWTRQGQLVEGISDEGAYGWSMIALHRTVQDLKGNRSWVPVQEVTAKISFKSPQTNAGLAVATRPLEGATLVLITAKDTVEVQERQQLRHVTRPIGIPLDIKQSPHDQRTMSATSTKAANGMCTSTPRKLQQFLRMKVQVAVSAVKGDAESDTIGCEMIHSE